MTRRRWLEIIGRAAALIVLVATPLLAAAPADAAPRVGFHATIDNRDINSLTGGHPLKLTPDAAVIVKVDVTNNSATDLLVRSVNLNGRVMGLTFFSFETRIDLTVHPGATDSRTFVVELVGLNGQADGLIPGRLELLGAHRAVLVSHSFPSDVQGSLRSIYGAFGVVVALITTLLLLSSLIRLAAGRLSANRWSRGVRFGTAGVGLGLTLTFSLSALRLVLPNPADWVSILFLSTIALFVVGYLTPTPSIYFPPEEDDELDDSEFQPYPAAR